MSIGLALFLLVLLLLGNAFFVAAEFAMVSARRDQIEPRAAAGSGAARWALKGIEDVTTSLAATQLGITACSLLIGAVGEPAIARLIELPLVSAGVPEGLIHPIALALALLLVTYFHMVIGEMVPKNMSIARPARAAMTLGPILHVFVLVFRPVIWLLNEFANLLVRYVLRAQPRSEVASTFTSDEVAGFVIESGREGLLDEDQLQLLQRALGFEYLTAADVAIPAGELRTVTTATTIAEVERTCAETGFSRFPVSGQDDELIGYVHMKDLLHLVDADRDASLPADAVHELTTVPPDAKLRPVVRMMQRRNAHMALIAGEGQRAGAAAVITLEAALEQLVGEVRDATSASGRE